MIYYKGWFLYYLTQHRWRAYLSRDLNYSAIVSGSLEEILHIIDVVESRTMIIKNGSKGVYNEYN